MTNRTDSNPISDLELQARQIIDLARQELYHEREHSATAVGVLNAFQAMWGNSLTAERVKVIAIAICNMEFSSENIQKQLTRLVRRGHLRTRRDRGQRLYEINLH